jgi:hypothetical protein
MMTRLAYPTLAFDSLSQAIGLLRAGQAIEQRALFANLVWNVQGSLQALALGDPDKQLAGGAGNGYATPPALESQLEEFDGALRSAQSQLAAATTAAAESDAPNAVDPATIMAIINVVLQLIDAWRKRRQTPAPIPQA